MGRRQQHIRKTPIALIFPQIHTSIVSDPLNLSLILHPFDLDRRPNSSFQYQTSLLPTTSDNNLNPPAPQWLLPFQPAHSAATALK